jgi:ubiquinone/menaquinone biosynthesis C-methylase UbiE
VPGAWDRAALTCDLLQPVGLSVLRALGDLSYREFAVEMVRLADLQNSDHVLDAACGTGYLLPALHDAIGDGGGICALDFSPGMLERARRKTARKDIHGIEFRQAAVEELSLVYGERRFDAVLCCFAFPVFLDPQRALREMRAVLKPGGRLLISSARREGLETARYRPFWRWAMTRWHLGHHRRDEYESMFAECGLRRPEFHVHGMAVVVRSERP